MGKVRKMDEDLNFISHKEDKDGLYEKIFNDETIFENMLCAFYVFNVINVLPYKYTFTSTLYHSLALFKVAFTKYLKAKFDQRINTSNYIIKIYQQGEKKIIIQTFKFIHQFIKQQIEVSDNEEKTTERILKFLFQPLHYERIKEALEYLEISVMDIESLIIKDDEKLIEEGIDQENSRDI